MIDLDQLLDKHKRLPDRLRIAPVTTEAEAGEQEPSSQEIDSPAKTQEGIPAKYFVPVDDSVGKIGKLALSFYSGQNEDTRNSYAKIYTDLIIKLARVYEKQDPPLHITVINPDNDPIILNKVHDAIATLAEFAGEMILNRDSIRFNLLNPSQNGLPYWIQDYFLAFQSRERNAGLIRIIENATGKLNDNDAANSIFRSLNQKPNLKLQLDASDLPFEGGNILFVGDYALVGYDNLRRRNRTFIEEEDFIDSFSKLTGIPEKKIILLGTEKHPNDAILNGWFTWLSSSTKQPIFHLDTFITPAGTEVDSHGEKKYRLLIGDPICHYHVYPKALNYTKKYIEHFIEILSTYSVFSIYRNPLPLTYIDINKKRKWFFASYNNCLVQFTEDSNKKNNFVFLPTYGGDYSNEYSGYKNTRGGDWSELNLFDQYNKSIWESLGFQVISLTNYLPLAEHRGAVRCITNVLQRV